MYTLTLNLSELPAGARETVWSTLMEYDVQVMVLGRNDKGTIDVTGNQRVMRDACRVALEKVGKTVDDVVIDLFS